MASAPETVNVERPSFDGDLWAEDVIENPYETYRALRAIGPAVYLTRNDAWAFVRHDSVRAALLDAETFSSAKGCTMNAAMNQAFAGVMLCSDDPRHREMRRVFAKPLLPPALAPLKERLSVLAGARVASLVAKREFDAVSELAHYLPLTVVTELVGFSEEGKMKMLDWAAAVFEAFGPENNGRTLDGMAVLEQAFAYLQTVDRNDLAAEGWGAALFAAADRGEIDHQQAQTMLMDYLAPSLDTTIHATSAAVSLFASHPAQWQKVRENPGLIGPAIDEVVRLESPIRGFSRYVTRDYAVGGFTVPAGSRALMVYASANRDERRYADPDRFDVERRPRDHVAFGYGAHVCAGMHLAKLEITVLLEHLSTQVERFHLVSSKRALNNTLRGLAELVVRVEPA